MSGTAQTARTPAAVEIERLALDIPGLTPDAAGRLAFLVAGHLARAGFSGSSVAVPRLTVTLDSPDIDLDRIAWQIARAVQTHAQAG